MPNYSVSSPSGKTFDIDAPSEDHAKQLVQQRFFNGLEPPSEAPQAPIDLSGFFSTEQHALAQQLAAKRTGDPDAAPTAADYFKAKDQLQPQNEAERAYEDEQRAKLRKQQREQARLNVIWGEDDAPSSFLSEEETPPLQPAPSAKREGFARLRQQQQAQPWSSITNRMVIASALRNLRNRRALAGLRSPRNKGSL